MTKEADYFEIIVARSRFMHGLFIVNTDEKWRDAFPDGPFADNYIFTNEDIVPEGPGAYKVLCTVKYNDPSDLDDFDVVMLEVVEIFR